MKILFFIDSMTSGGKERRLTELIKSLDTIPGIEVGLAVMSEGIHYEDIKNLNISIYEILRNRKRDLFVFQKFYQLCKEFKPDIVHCWDSMTAIFAIPACKILNIKLVNGLVVDAPAKNSIFNKYIIRARLSFLFSDVIIGNSKAGIKAYNAASGKSKIIPNGFDFNRIQILDDLQSVRKELNAENALIIGMVANFSVFKDYPTFYRSAEILLARFPDAIFVCVGKETDSPESKNMINGENLKNFRLLGKRSDIERLIQGFDVCVLSTFTEGISNSVLEYMACGKAVVATNGGGTNEIVINNETGFLVNPSNPRELAGRISELLESKELRDRMGKAGKARVKNEFSIEVMVNRFVETYNNLLKKR
ncbi:MAG: glycosyltransferase [Bacteroidales bacterium]|nr:glycosyltransferase [Bacteroidales bacterium]